MFQILAEFADIGFNAVAELAGEGSQNQSLFRGYVFRFEIAGQRNAFGFFCGGGGIFAELNVKTVRPFLKVNL